MANLLVTYDLNGPAPSHASIDEAMLRCGSRHARILETVWWVDYPGTAIDLRDRLRSLFGREDLLLVVECGRAAWTKLLVPDAPFKSAFEAA